MVSGKSLQVCIAQKFALKQYLEKRAKQVSADFLSNLSYSLCTRRSHFGWRWGASAITLEELMEALNDDVSAPQKIKHQPKIGFVFTGQGSQWHAMGRELISKNAVFTSSLRRGDECLENLGAPWSLIGMLSLKSFCQCLV